MNDSTDATMPMNAPATAPGAAGVAAAGPLAGRVAFVTGAGKGLGRAIAHGFAQAGADLGLVARTRADLEVLAQEVQACGRRALVAVADVTDSAQIGAAVDAALAAFGRIDILVNAAGGSLRKRSGAIINLASTAGVRGRAANAPYSAAKAAVINFSKAIAMEWAAQGVRVNVLAPGRFLTPLTEAEMSVPEKYAAFVRQVPLGRIGQPEEIKEIAVWLAGDASAFVTGSVITLDGGQTLA